MTKKKETAGAATTAAPASLPNVKATTSENTTEKVAGEAEVKTNSGDASDQNADADKSVNAPLVNANDPEEVAGAVAPGTADAANTVIEAPLVSDQTVLPLVNASDPSAHWNLPEHQKGARKRKVRFLLSPTGRFGLGYGVGEEAEFETKQAAELVESGYAEYVDAAE